MELNRPGYSGESSPRVPPPRPESPSSHRKPTRSKTVLVHSREPPESRYAMPNSERPGDDSPGLGDAVLSLAPQNRLVSDSVPDADEGGSGGFQRAAKADPRQLERRGPGKLLPEGEKGRSEWRLSAVAGRGYPLGRVRSGAEPAAAGDARADNVDGKIPAESNVAGDPDSPIPPAPGAARIL